MSQSLPKGKEMAADILSRVENIIYLTGVINSAANRTLNDIARLKDASHKHQTLVLEANKPGVIRNRIGAPSDVYRISYNPADITLIGGSVLTIYDHLLPAFKERHDIHSLQTYMQRKTTDIDMVWWPTIQLNDQAEYLQNIPLIQRRLIQKAYAPEQDPSVVLSTSPAILEVVRVFKDALNDAFQAELPTIQELVLKVLRVSEAKSFEIKITQKSLEIAGTHTILISFVLNGIPIDEICQISLHDGGSSQLYTRSGERNSHVEPMHHDPVHCTVKNAYLIHLRDMNVKVPHVQSIQIPSILSFVEQQLFAFGNHLLAASVTQPDKYGRACVHFKRVFYLKLLLSEFDLTNKSNRQNYTTHIKRYIPRPEILCQIEEAIQFRRRIFALQIHQAMQQSELQHDPILHFLFDPMVTLDVWNHRILEAKHQLLRYKKMYMQTSTDPMALEVLLHFTKINEAFAQLPFELFKTYYHVIMLRTHVNHQIYQFMLQLSLLKARAVQEGRSIFAAQTITSQRMQYYLEISTLYDAWKDRVIDVQGLSLEVLTTPLRTINVMVMLMEEKDRFATLIESRQQRLTSLLLKPKTARQ